MDSSACCYSTEVIEHPAEFTDSQQSAKKSLDDAGINTDVGGKSMFCLGGKDWKTNLALQDENNQFAEPSTGMTIKGFCAGAMKQAALAAGAVASLAIVGSF